MKKRIIVLLSAAVLLLLVTAVPASAKSHSTSFTRTHTWHSAPLKRWFKLELTGRIKAKSWSTGSGRTTTHHFGKPELVSPKLTVRVYSNSAMTKRAKVSKLELRQFHYDKSCRTKPSFSVSASTSKALSIGASFTRHCSKFTTAYRDSTYGKAHAYTQSTSGATVVWKKKYVSWAGRPGNPQTPKKTVCVTPEFELQPYIGTNRDDLRKSHFKDICISNR